MLFSKKAAALAAGFLAVLSAVTVAQNVAPGAAGRSGAETYLIDDATVDWIEKSDVAALREGVIESMELQIGMPVQRGRPIGKLHAEMAELTVAKAQLAVTNVAAQAKAEAQKELAMTVVATNVMLNKRQKNLVSNEEMRKAEAEVKVSHAMVEEAIEKRELDRADLALAKRTLEEHIIRAPFDGLVIDRMKHPGESVRANEAVVRVGNLDKLRVFGYVSLEYAFAVKEGAIVEFQPRISGSRANRIPLENKKFRGKITFVDPQIQAVGETARRIYAEFDNRDRELQPGLKGTLTIYLNAPEAAPPAVGARTAAPGLLPR